MVNKPIFLKNITFIKISEVSLIMDYPPYNQTEIIEKRAEMPLSMGAEIHK
ncbi:hypothetical protein DSAG12_04115 [Promethearchaeum syntrophicum]|uniref:Uncharacterized protein n=1 Tax=Promethearchaeum syntrophicum TaxID=2594042 RepID=A0AC61ZTY0_9ARCH|nr:hypothetical protein [Candidatus Prometheoarchaeum syntrophicum]